MRQATPGPSAPADRVNRRGLVLLGLILLGIGAYGMARSAGAFGDRAASEPLLVDSWRRFVADNEAWFWPVVAVASVVVALIGLRWLRAQLAAGKPSALDLTSREEGGSTTVDAGGAASALAADVEQLGGVQRASARLRGDADGPEIDLRVDVDDDCDLPALRRTIDDAALTRFCQALELEPAAVNLEFRLSAPNNGHRVR